MSRPSVRLSICLSLTQLNMPSYFSYQGHDFGSSSCPRARGQSSRTPSLPRQSFFHTKRYGNIPTVASNARGMKKSRFSTNIALFYRKWYKIKLYLQRQTNSKSYMVTVYWTMPLLTTLNDPISNDLEWLGQILWHEALNLSVAGRLHKELREWFRVWQQLVSTWHSAAGQVRHLVHLVLILFAKSFKLLK